MLAYLRQQTTQEQIRDVLARVEPGAVEPDAQRAWLCTTERDLVAPMRYLVDNAVRHRVDPLGDALSPTDREHRGGDLRLLGGRLELPLSPLWLGALVFQMSLCVIAGNACSLSTEYTGISPAASMSRMRSSF